MGSEKELSPNRLWKPDEQIFLVHDLNIDSAKLFLFKICRVAALLKQRINLN